MSAQPEYARLLVKHLVRSTMLAAPREGRVIAKDRVSLFGLGVALGDRVSFSDRAGEALQIDGEQHWILGENDVLAVLG